MSLFDHTSNHLIREIINKEAPRIIKEYNDPSSIVPLSETCMRSTFSLFGSYNDYVKNIEFVVNIINKKLFCALMPLDGVYDLLQIYYKHRNALLFFKERILRKKSEHFDYNYSIGMEPLSDYKEMDKINMRLNERLYTFVLEDLHNIIKTAITNTSYLSVMPSKIKNPFTNIPFTLGQLYNIYLHFRYQKKFRVSNIVYSFWKNNFDYESFILENNFMLRKKAVRDHINEISHNELFDYVLDIMYVYKNLFSWNIVITDSTDIKKVSNIFKTAIFHFLCIDQFNDPPTKSFFQKSLRNEIAYIDKEHKFFERQVIKLRRRPRISNNFVNSSLFTQTNELPQLFPFSHSGYNLRMNMMNGLVIANNVMNNDMTNNEEEDTESDTDSDGGSTLEEHEE
jgi:hypothetical protein